ncbi:MAG: hypothetical protein FGM15_07110 [Chthoniobacterales bacterium]|nr:hypothetical protein [Chthoniobacterales bacterium]
MVSKVGEPPQVKEDIRKEGFRVKVEIRGEVESWPQDHRSRFGVALVDALVALVRLDMLEPIEYDPTRKHPGTRDGLRLGLVFKSGKGRDQYGNTALEAGLVRALKRHGIAVPSGIRVN